MADKPTRKNKKGAGRPDKYPWTRWWQNDDWFTLRRGADYQCATTTFMQMIRSRANRLGGKVSIKVISDTEIKVLIRREL